MTFLLKTVKIKDEPNSKTNILYLMGKNCKKLYSWVTGQKNKVDPWLSDLVSDKLKTQQIYRETFFARQRKFYNCYFGWYEAIKI